MASTDGASLATEASKEVVIVSKSRDPKTLTSTGLLSPAATPEVDDARLKADKKRQQAVVTPVAVSEGNHEPKPRTPLNKGKGRAALSPDKSQTASSSNSRQALIKPPQSSIPNKPPQSDGPDRNEGQGESSKKGRPGQHVYTEEQKMAEVERIIDVNPMKYYKVLNAKDTDEKAEILVDAAAKELGVDDQHFAANAYGNENDEPLPTPPLKENEAPPPPEYALQVYDKAERALTRLMTNSDDSSALKALARYNNQILARNEEDHRPALDFEIPVPTLQAYFKAIAPSWQKLVANPADRVARREVVKVNDLIKGLVKQRGLPNHWFFEVPSIPGVPEVPEDSDMAGTAAGIKGVKTKINVSLPDESDGNTSLGLVTTVKKAGGNGFRVIVNRGTEEHPYFNIYPGNTFGNGVAAGWYESKLYESEDLPAKLAIGGEVTLYGRVTVARPSRSRYRPGSGIGGGINRPMQFYMCRAGEQKFVSTKTALLKAKGNSVRKQKIIDRDLDREDALLLKELDDFRRNNKHPDTGEQLTDEDINQMPWLSSDAIADNIDDEISTKQEGDDEDDIEFRVAPRKPLGRGEQASASTNLEPLKSPSVESDL